MGMSISAIMIVGNTYDNLQPEIFDWAEKEYGEDWEEERDVTEIIEEMGLSYASPYYDSPTHDWFIGIEISELDLTSTSDKGDWNNELYLAKKKLVQLFGDTIVIYLTAAPHVT